ncbi:Adenylate cyclase 2 [Diplonema papillatum]|nr:Adenylate cyclase 2 [Diplonema papillatum]
MESRRWREAESVVKAETLFSFLPKVLVEDLRLTAPEYKIHASCRVFDCALLFVDVTGFSDVAHRLQEFTAEGSETLTFHLNAYFSQIIAVVEKWGGDIILFSGDAVMVAWHSDRHLEDCQRSALCGIDLLSEAGSYKFTFTRPNENSQINFEMNLHLAASSGPTMGAIVGGVGSKSLGLYKYVLLGRSIESLGFAVSLSGKSELILTPDIIHELGGTISFPGRASRPALFNAEFREFVAVTVYPGSNPKGAETTENASTCMTVHSNSDLKTNLVASPARSEARQAAVAARPDADPVKLAHLATSFIFDTLLYSSAQGAHGQLRTVSAVFINLCSLKMGDLSDAQANTKIHEGLNSAVCIIQKGLLKTDGVLNKVVMDDKGIVCICLFGIPYHSHEDNVERSAIFALKMAKKLCSAVGPTAIGVAKANVYCGMTGSESRREYTVLGSGVNLAARLMSKCEEYLANYKRQVLCDVNTMQAVVSSPSTASRVAFVPAGELALKGRDKPVACYHLVNAGEKELFVRKMNRERVPNGRASTSSSDRSSSRGSKCSSSSSFGSIFSLSSRASSFVGYRRNQGNQVHADTRSASSYNSTPVKPSPRVLPCQRSVQSIGERSVHSSFASQKRSEHSLPNPAEMLIGRSQALIAILGHCEQWFTSRTRRDLKRSSKDALDASANEVYPPFGICGGMQMGKTRLLRRVEEILGQRATFGSNVIWIQGSESVTVGQFEAIKPLVSKFVLSMDLVDMAASQTLDTEKLAFLSYIVRDDRLALPSSKQSALSTEEKLCEVSAALLMLIKSEVGWPVYILIDDIHLIDPWSSFFLLYAQKKGCRIIFTKRTFTGSPLFVRKHGGPEDIMSRSSGSDEGVDGLGHAAPDLDSKDWQALVDCEGKVVLSALSEREHYDLMVSICGLDVDPGFAHDLYQKTLGVPGFTVQILNSLFDATHLTHRYGQTGVAKNYAVSERTVHFVAGLEPFVLRKVDMLMEDVRNTLLLCSVQGPVFSRELLSKVARRIPALFSKKSSADIEHLFKGLISAGFVVKAKPGANEADPATSYRFEEQLAKDAVYLTLLSGVRKKYHIETANVLRETQAAGGSWKVIFDHYTRAEEEPPVVIAHKALYELIRGGTVEGTKQCLEALKAAKWPSDDDRQHVAAVHLTAAAVHVEAGECLEAEQSIMRVFSALAPPPNARRKSVLSRLSLSKPEKPAKRTRPPRKTAKSAQPKPRRTFPFFCCAGDPGDSEPEAEDVPPSPDKPAGAETKTTKEQPVVDPQVERLALTLNCELAFLAGNAKSFKSALKTLHASGAAKGAAPAEGGSTPDAAAPQGKSPVAQDVGQFFLSATATLPASSAARDIELLRACKNNELNPITLLSLMASKPGVSFIRMYPIRHDPDRSLIRLPALPGTASPKPNGQTKKSVYDESVDFMVYAGPGRLAVVCTLWSLKAIVGILTGDADTVLVNVDALRGADSGRWSLVALHIRFLAAKLLQLAGTGLTSGSLTTPRPAPPPSAQRSMSVDDAVPVVPLITPRQIAANRREDLKLEQAWSLGDTDMAELTADSVGDPQLFALVSATQSKAVDVLAKCAEVLPSPAPILTPYHAIAAVGMAEKLLSEEVAARTVVGAKDQEPLPSSACAVQYLQKVAVKYPLFQPCAKFYEALHLLHIESEKSSAYSLFIECIKSCSEFDMGQSTFVYRSLARLVMNGQEELVLQRIPEAVERVDKDGGFSKGLTEYILQESKQRQLNVVEAPDLERLQIMNDVTSETARSI